MNPTKTNPMRQVATRFAAEDTTVANENKRSVAETAKRALQSPPNSIMKLPELGIPATWRTYLTWSGGVTEVPPANVNKLVPTSMGSTTHVREASIPQSLGKGHACFATFHSQGFCVYDIRLHTLYMVQYYWRSTLTAWVRHTQELLAKCYIIQGSKEQYSISEPYPPEKNVRAGKLMKATVYIIPFVDGLLYTSNLPSYREWPASTLTQYFGISEVLKICGKRQHPNYNDSIITVHVTLIIFVTWSVINFDVFVQSWFGPTKFTEEMGIVKIQWDDVITKLRIRTNLKNRHVVLRIRIKISSRNLTSSPDALPPVGNYQDSMPAPSPPYLEGKNRFI
ncbi:hypothetical protein BDZ94DRAFT_1300052 [Collybia nuda]|uniref:Uncharacterized protein n=1 Tax=Collybia nuda TaxID=64659 RepID=A0A9P6CGS6_9AGAR|nr:hypothetical protein BDZ94DRAFT_1300052 [Collybia nuda]